MLARMKKGAKKNQRKPGFIKAVFQMFWFFCVVLLIQSQGTQEKKCFFDLITSCNKFIIVGIKF